MRWSDVVKLLNMRSTTFELGMSFERFKPRVADDDALEALIRIDSRLLLAPDSFTRWKYKRGPLELWKLVLLHSGVCPDQAGFETYSCACDLFQKGLREPHWECEDFVLTARERLGWNGLLAENDLASNWLERVDDKHEAGSRTLVWPSVFSEWADRQLTSAGPFPSRCDAAQFKYRTRMIDQAAELTHLVEPMYAGDAYVTNEAVAQVAKNGLGVNICRARKLASVVRPDGARRGAPPKSQRRSRRVNRL